MVLALGRFLFTEATGQGTHVPHRTGEAFTTTFLLPASAALRFVKTELQTLAFGWLHAECAITEISFLTLAALTSGEFEAHAFGAQDVVFTSLGARVHIGAVFLVRAAMERTAVPRSPVDAGDSLLVTALLQSLECLALGALHLPAVAGVGTDIDFTRIEQLLWVKACDLDAFAKRSTGILEATTKSGSSNLTLHSTLAPRFRLGRSGCFAATAMTG